MFVVERHKCDALVGTGSMQPGLVQLQWVHTVQSTSDTSFAIVPILPVNDAPALTVPPSKVLTPDTATAITGISVSDIDTTT